MSDMDYEVPAVARAKDERGSSVKPPLRTASPDLDRLRWHAAVAELDAGLAPGSIRVADANYRISGIAVSGYYCIAFPNGSVAPYDFGGAWAWINGFRSGLECAQIGGN